MDTATFQDLKSRISPDGTVHQCWMQVRDERIEFHGPKGKHTLDLASSDVDRVKAHWEGFLEGNGASRTNPQPGDRVVFHSASTFSQKRKGTVVEVRRGIVTISYKFTNGNPSQTTRNVLGVKVTGRAKLPEAPTPDWRPDVAMAEDYYAA